MEPGLVVGGVVEVVVVGVVDVAVVVLGVVDVVVVDVVTVDVVVVVVASMLPAAPAVTKVLLHSNYSESQYGCWSRPTAATQLTRS